MSNDNVYDLVLHRRDPIEGKTSSWYRRITRSWASVPRVGDYVSLGGGDAALEPVAFVQFCDGSVRLHFNLLNPTDVPPVQVLYDLGFSQPT